MRMRLTMSALVALILILGAGLVQAQSPPNTAPGDTRVIIPGELVLHDNSVFTLNDNPNLDVPAFIPNCTPNSQGVSGGRWIGQLNDTVINDSCVGGIRTNRRVVIVEGDDPGELMYVRKYCGKVLGVYLPPAAGCGFGNTNWAYEYNGSAIRFAYVGAKAQTGIRPDGTMAGKIHFSAIGMDGQLVQVASTNPGAGWTIFKNGGVPVCELAGEGGHQGFTFFWDTRSEAGPGGALAVQMPFPDCSIKHLTLEP